MKKGLKYGSIEHEGIEPNKESLKRALQNYVESSALVYRYKNSINPFEKDTEMDIIGKAVGFDDKNIYVEPCEGKEEEFENAKLFLGWAEGNIDKVKKQFEVKKITTIRVKSGKGVK